MYNKTEPISKVKTQDELDLNTLMQLSEDQEGLDLIDRIDLESLLAVNIPTKKPIIQSSLKRKSDKFPPIGSNINLSAFLTLTTREINNIKFHPKSSTNMSEGERNALNTLTKQTQLTIKLADKGGNIALMNN